MGSRLSPVIMAPAGHYVQSQMSMHDNGKQMISIWFFIGLLLLVYGAIIMSVGMWELFSPPAHPPVLAELRPSLWWGALILILGAVFVGTHSKW